MRFALGLLILFAYLFVLTRQDWVQVVKKSASDPAVFKRQQTRQNYDRAYSQRDRSQSPRSDCSTNYKLDYLLMSVQWAPGFCQTSPTHCVKKMDNHFTIHGMWPQLAHSEGPQFCCYENNFDMKLLNPILNDLNEYWPSFFRSDNRGFWSHEWLKHGTCAKNVLSLQGELNYFRSTLLKMRGMRILDTLKSQGIVPSSSAVYKSNKIQDALAKISGTRVMIDCDYEHDQNIPVLTGLNFCFDPNLKPIDCGPSKSRCSRDIRFLSA